MRLAADGTLLLSPSDFSAPALVGEDDVPAGRSLPTCVERAEAAATCSSPSTASSGVTVGHVAGRGDEGRASAGNATADKRRHFACPSASGRYQGTELEYLDPNDPDERRILIEAEHPELHKALRRGDDEIVIAGQPISPRLHIAMHEIVASQLWEDDPPEAWQTAQRLVALGYERHEVLHMLSSVVAREVWRTLDSGLPSDTARYVVALGELPESYFALSDEP